MGTTDIILSKSAKIVQTVLHEKKLPFTVVELEASTRTAQDAAEALGCSVAQIIKSLLFQDRDTKQPILILASGINRVNEQIIAAATGIHLAKADAHYTRQVTGFAIGGVPPIGHKQSISTFIDEDLLRYDELWAAAGTPNAVFKSYAKNLVELTQGIIIAIH